MKELLLKLESDEVNIRLQALEELAKKVDNIDKAAVIKALKPHILDWDDNVRAKVAHVLKLYTGR